MKIVSISLYHIRIPLKINFRHALASRDSTDNAIVETTLDNGISGFGESVPREYVTGETVDTVFDSLSRICPKLLGKQFNTHQELLDSLNVIVSCHSHNEHIEKNIPDSTNNRSRYSDNAAKCAIELSLLDACGKYFKQPIIGILRDNCPKPSHITYSGIISGGSLSSTTWSALKMRCYGFKYVKAKIGIETKEGNDNHFSPSAPPYDVKRIHRIRRILGNQIDLRVDANGAWSVERAILIINALEKLGISAVEQPIKHEDFPCLKEVRSKVNVPIMLDESLRSMEDAKRAVEGGYCDMFNIRLSKCGGLLNSLKIADFARQNGIGFQLGCQVGETGILSAAGRHFAMLVPDAKFLEGSYDKHLLKENVIRQDLTFGYGGKARPITASGLGIDIDREKLEQLTIKRTIIGK